MKYRIVSIVGNTKKVIAEVCTKAWADTFADEVRKWLMGNGIGSIKIVVEEIK